MPRRLSARAAHSRPPRNAVEGHLRRWVSRARPIASVYRPPTGLTLPLNSSSGRRFMRPKPASISASSASSTRWGAGTSARMSPDAALDMHPTPQARRHDRSTVAPTRGRLTGALLMDAGQAILAA